MNKIIDLFLNFLADGVRCYQCIFLDSSDLCWLSPQTSGHVVDCEPEQNGCSIIYFNGKKLKMAKKICNDHKV